MDEWPNHEATLVQRAAQGDQGAFADLYERYFDAVYDFLTRLLKDREAAADVTQDTFIKAMNNVGSVREGASFKSWLFTIAHNTGLNHLQRAARTQPMPTSGDDDEPAFDVVDTDRFGSPEEAAEATQMSALVWEAAAGMDARQYAVLDLTLRQGLESAELAEVLHVSKNNAYVLVNRMKKTLEESVAALMLFRDRRHCEQLTALLSAREVMGMSPDTRRLIDRHAGRCDACQQKRASLTSPSAIFGGLVLIPAPAGLKLSISQVLHGGGAAAGSGDGQGADGGPGARGGQSAEAPQYADATYNKPEGAWQPPSSQDVSPYSDAVAAANSRRNKIAAGIAAIAAVIFGLGLALGSGSDSKPNEPSQTLLGADQPEIASTLAALAMTQAVPGAATATETPQADPAASVVEQPAEETTPVAAMPGGPGLAPGSGPGSTPVASMPGSNPGLAPGGSGPEATPTPQMLVQPPVATATTQPSILNPTPTSQPAALVATTTPPTRTPTPVPCVPTAVIAASTLEFGTSTNAQTITLKSDGCTSPLAFAATPSANWISTTPSSGSIPLNGTRVVSVRTVQANMAPGLNVGRVRVITVHGTVDITVRGMKSTIPPTRTPTPCPAPCLASP